MRMRMMGTGIVVLLVLALVSPLYARPASVPLSLAAAARIGDKQLQPGSYRLVVYDNKVSVLQESKVVAEAAGEWVQNDTKSKADGVKTDGGVIKEIYVAGRTGHFAVH